ncbi:MAG: DUF4249 domain-containing protein [Bacteroidales bacterium]|nr:DUF4249 domain-containing protein [Bacteroidales bacterium]
MKIEIILVFLLLTFASCIKEVDFNVGNVPQRLVINSVMEAYNPITVNVSGLQSILDTSLLFINNANVIIEEEGGNTDTLDYTSNGDYVSSIVSMPGRIYRLVVEASGYPTVFSCDTVPLRVNIKYASKKESVTLDEEGSPHNDFSVTFSPIEDKINYYELFFMNQRRNEDLNYNFDFEASAVSIDPLIQASGTADYNSITYLFSDATVSESEYTIAMKMINYITGGGEYAKPIITGTVRVHAAVLRTVSKAYYDYRCSWEKHQCYKNDSTKIEDIIYVPLIGEPEEMYSNIENGLGVFVAYNQDYYILRN